MTFAVNWIVWHALLGGWLLINKVYSCLSLCLFRLMTYYFRETGSKARSGYIAISYQRTQWVYHITKLSTWLRTQWWNVHIHPPESGSLWTYQVGVWWLGDSQRKWNPGKWTSTIHHQALYIVTLFWPWPIHTWIKMASELFCPVSKSVFIYITMSCMIKMLNVHTKRQKHWTDWLNFLSTSTERSGFNQCSLRFALQCH